MMMMMMGARNFTPHGPLFRFCPYVCTCLYGVPTGLDDGMYIMYVSMCSIGWDGTVETWGLGCFYALFCKKRISG